MSEIDDQRLMAYADGELDAAGRAEVEAAMRADPAVAERVARHRALREAMAGAFGGVLDEPVPERLVAAATAPQDAPVLRPRFGGRTRGAFGPAAWGAMAASLVVGVAVGRGLAAGDAGPFESADGRLQARGGLASALDRQLAADHGASKIMVGLTFQTPARSYCRTFQMSREALAGLACREGGRWVVQMTAASPAGARDPGGYRMAASALPAPVLARVDEMIAGAPLNREQELKARAAGWKP